MIRSQALQRTTPSIAGIGPSSTRTARNALCSPVSLPGAHAIVLLDQAGWHGAKALKVPSNISLMPLPPRAPELNGQENIWQFMRQNWLSNRVFQIIRRFVHHCCYVRIPTQSGH